VRQRRADQPDRAEEGAIDGLPPGRLVEIVEAAERRPAAVDEQQVEPTEGLDGRGDGRRGTVLRREVGGHGHGGFAEAAGRRLDPLGRAGHEGDPSPFRDECRGDCRAQPARRTAEQRARSSETQVHPILPANRWAPRW
jgi:hypothetical protein